MTENLVRTVKTKIALEKVKWINQVEKVVRTEAVATRAKREGEVMSVQSARKPKVINIRKMKKKK